MMDAHHLEPLSARSDTDAPAAPGFDAWEDAGFPLEGALVD